MEPPQKKFKPLALELLESSDKIKYEDVLLLLENTNIPMNSQRKNVLPEGIREVQSITLGAIMPRQSTKVKISNVTDTREAITKVLCRIMQEEEPDFKFTSICLNKNYAAKRHRDKNNLGDSRLIAFGDFTGGELVIEDPNRPRVENPKHNFLKFNGNNYHEVCEFTGTRYSCVYFTVGNYREMEAEEESRLLELGFNPPDKSVAVLSKKEEISEEIKRLQLKYVEIKDPSVPAANEIFLVSGGFDILVCLNQQQAVAKIETLSSTFCPLSGLTCSIINPSRLGKSGDKIITETYNFYGCPAVSTEKFENMARIAIENGFILVGTVVNTVAKQKVELPNKFYEILESLGIKANTRIAYRRPWIFAAYLGQFEECRGDRHELVRMKIKIDNETLSVYDKEIINMCEGSNEVSTNAMPVFPVLGNVEPQFDKENYTIVIPSYDRHDQIWCKTLNFLYHHEIPINKIFIFVANEDESEKYLEVLGEKWKVIQTIAEVSEGNGNVVIGALGVRAQREFIVRFFEEKTYIVSLDDDVSDVMTVTDSMSLKSLGKGEFKSLLHFAALLMIKTKSYIWSVNTSSNPQSMHPTHVSRKAGICNGFLYGFFNRHFEEILPSLGDAAEDVERSARYFMCDGVVLRFRMLTCKTNFYSGKGGLQKIFTSNHERKGAEITHLDKIASLFGSLVIINEKRIQSQKDGLNQRTLPVHFRQCGAAPLSCKEYPWRHSTEHVSIDGSEVVSEPIRCAAGKRGFGRVCK